MDRRQFLTSAAAIGGASLLPVGGAQAQGAYPTKQINMIVAFPPGGQADISARPVAEFMRKRFNQNVIVENRAGAGGKTGNTAVAKSAPDGYTALMALSSMLVIPEADKLFGRPVTYEVADLRPVARVLADPVMVSVRADSPWKTLPELLDAAKKAPGTIAFSSSGPYGALHVPIEMIAGAAGVKFLHVPFTGGGPAVNALLQGSVQFTGGAPGPVKPHADAGTFRVLACTGTERAAAFPNVPTCQELGLKDVNYYIWSGLFVPAKTPEAVVTTLREAMRDAMKDPSVAAVFNKAGSPPAWMDAPDFAKFVAADHARLTEAVKKIGKT